MDIHLNTYFCTIYYLWMLILSIHQGITILCFKSDYQLINFSRFIAHFDDDNHFLWLCECVGQLSITKYKKVKHVFWTLSIWVKYWEFGEWLKYVNFGFLKSILLTLIDVNEIIVLRERIFRHSHLKISWNWNFQYLILIDIFSF